MQTQQSAQQKLDGRARHFKASRKAESSTIPEWTKEPRKSYARTTRFANSFLLTSSSGATQPGSMKANALAGQTIDKLWPVSCAFADLN